MIAVTFFRSLVDAVGVRVRFTSWASLFARFETPRHFDAKERAPRWSPAVFSGDRRSLANVEAIGSVVVDIDVPAPCEVVVGAIEGAGAFIHSTWSSTAAAPRWRVVVPTDRPMRASDYRPCFRLVAARLERSGVTPDLAASDASRIWSVPACPARAAYRHVHLVGPALNVDACVREFGGDERPRTDGAENRRAFVGADRVARARSYVRLCTPAVSGNGGHATTFRVALALVRGFELGEADALRILVEEFNPRCVPPWSQRELLHKVRSAASRARVAPGWLLDPNRVAQRESLPLPVKDHKR